MEFETPGNAGRFFGSARSVSKVLKAAAQWAVVALLCLAAAELALRLQQWWGPLYDLEANSANYDWYSDVVNHRPVRHSVHTFTGKSMFGALDGVTYTEDFDELGIRQPVSSAGAGNCPNRIAILFMGDSFIEGYDVPHTVPAEVAHRLRHHTLGVGAFRYVGHNRDRFAAAFRDLRRYRTRVVSGAVDHRDLCAFGRKNQRGGASDSRSASSNQGDFSVELAHSLFHSV